MATFPLVRHHPDLLRLPVVRRLVKSAYFPFAVQMTALLVYGGLIYVGFLATTEAARYSNLASLVIWTLWWPGLVLLTFVQTRLWCTACPIGLVSRTLGRNELRLKVPRWLRRNRLGVLFGLFALHSLVVAYAVNHIPALTSVYLLGLLGYAAAIALLFEPDAFCNSFCPLSGIVGSYAMLSPTELRSSDTATCKACREHRCVKICPRNLYMGTLDSNQDCLLCLDCVKACPNDNIVLRRRAPLQDLWQERTQTVGTALLVVLLLGIMVEEVGEEWSRFEAATKAVPDFLAGLGLPERIGGYSWLEALWLNFVLPLLVVGLAAVLVRLLVKTSSVRQNFVRYTPALLPLVFSLHLAKMVHNLNAHLRMLPYALAEPAGTKTAAALAMNPSSAPASLLANNYLEGALLLAIVVLGVLGSFHVVDHITYSRSEPGRQRALAVYYGLLVFLGGAFLVVIARWFALGPA